MWRGARKGVALLVLAQSACFRSRTGFIEPAHASKTAMVEPARAPKAASRSFRLRTYKPSRVSEYGQPVFTEVTVNGTVFRPFGADFGSCSAEPGSEPKAVVCESPGPDGDGAKAHFYVIVPTAPPMLVLVSTRNWGAWVKDRHLYFLIDEWRLVNTTTGDVRDLPNPPPSGAPRRFIGFSPDGTNFLWWDDQETVIPDSLVLHLTRATDGHEVSATTVDRYVVPWILDWTHEEDPGGPAGWIANHFTWTKTAAGDWAVTYASPHG